MSVVSGAGLSKAAAFEPGPAGPGASRRTGRAVGDEELATFFEVSLDLLCIRDSDFRIVKVNDAWTTALGYPREELEGAWMLDFIHPDDAPASSAHMQRMTTEDEVDGFVNRYRRRDGAYVHLEWRAKRVGDLVYGVARDVTDRLAVQAQMAAAQRAAEAANQAKSDFLANMSHEIRTPLNGVIGIAAALRRTELTEPQREMVTLIERSGATLERLVSDVLDLSKIEAGELAIERRPFDLWEELGAVIDMFRVPAQQKGLGFHVDRAPAVRGMFVGDGLRLKQVLANLLSNAVKFTSAGELRVRLAIEDAPDALNLVLQVEDTGEGFDEAVARRVFERFHQADNTIARRHGGTGLGLSICRALVELMDGRIEAFSRPGHGSRFVVTVPLARLGDEGTAARAAGAGDAAPAPVSLAGTRVLVAEDHPVNRRVIQLILEPLGVELVMAEDGAQAVEAFGTSSFDLVLMDMQMPVMDGLSATSAIRALEAQAPGRRRTPVMMLSANAMPHHLEAAEKAGADLHIAKPLNAESLIDGVATLIGGGLAPTPRASRGGRAWRGAGARGVGRR